MKNQRSISLRKRIALSVIAIATPLIGAQRAGAQTVITLTQAETEQGICSSIYDDTSDAPINPTLQSEVNAFAAQGINADVLILKNGQKYGITDTESMRKFSQQRDAQCGNGLKTDVLVVVTEDPREFNTRVQNGACSEYWEDSRDNAIDEFRNGLKDTTTSKQQDAGNNLMAIRSANGVDSDRTLGTCDQSNVPIGWILGGAGVVGAAGVYAAYRYSKRSSSSRSSGYGGSGGGGISRSISTPSLGRSTGSRSSSSSSNDGFWGGCIGGSLGSSGGYSGGGYSGGGFDGGGSDGGGGY